MRRQEIEYIKNLNEFKRKFSILNEKLKNNLSLRDEVLMNILRAKEKIEEREDFYFSSFFVDGSLMRMGGNYPNFLYIFRSLSMNPFTKKKIFIYDLFSPIIDEDREYFESVLERVKRKEMETLTDLTYTEERIRYERMAKLEVEVAIDSIGYMKEGDILIMDGSLTHFQKQVEKDFYKLMDLCKDKGIIPVGIIEDVSGREIANISLSDKELLTGKLGIGEMIFIPYPERKKGFSTCYLRTSIDPVPIGFDILSDFRDRYRLVASFIMSITERRGRGIPIFLDEVDREVKLTEKEVRIIGKRFIDENIFDTFFTPKRRLR